jgi:hypothetical protein
MKLDKIAARCGLAQFIIFMPLTIVKLWHIRTSLITSHTIYFKKSTLFRFKLLLLLIFFSMFDYSPYLKY